MNDAAFALYEPVELTSCVVFASPHSGRGYSLEFLDQSRLDSHAIRASEDAFVDNLFQLVTDLAHPCWLPVHRAPMLTLIVPVMNLILH